MKTMSYSWIDTEQQKKKFIDQYDSYIFDCDGVIWQGSQLLPGAKEFLKGLHDAGKKLFFVTNNASKSRKEYHKKFVDLGVDFVKIENINGTANATAEYLLGQPHPINKVFCIGLSGLTQELSEYGIQTISLPKDTNNLEELADMDLDPDVNAVIVGMDNTFNYTKLATAALFIRYNEGCKFVATNLDSGSMQGKKGTRFVPGTGCLVTAVQVGCGREPDVVVGKPSSWWINHIIDANWLDRKRTVMFGDRLDTDTLFAAQGGIHSVLVLTGVTLSTDEITTIVPNFVVSGLGSFSGVFGK